MACASAVQLIRWSQCRQDLHWRQTGPGACQQYPTLSRIKTRFTKANCGTHPDPHVHQPCLGSISGKASSKVVLNPSSEWGPTATQRLLSRSTSGISARSCQRRMYSTGKGCKSKLSRPFSLNLKLLMDPDAISHLKQSSLCNQLTCQTFAKLQKADAGLQNAF